jgi:outer membrane cobalamin receptor
MKYLYLILVFLLFHFVGTAQDEKLDLYSLSLEDLINVEVSISTKSKVNLRETPGIVTVITAEDIQRSGARDIIELFQLYVPGFDFGVDVEGVVGMGIRGLWAHEGKFLFMVDGFEINDGMFGCVPFGNHFPLDNIERIEIIRGPGSSIYGGFAGLGVINILTRNSLIQNGKVTYTASHTGKQLNHNQISIGQTVINKNLKLNISTSVGSGSRSDKTYYDYYRNSRTLDNASNIYSKNLLLQLQYKNFKFQTYIDDYSFEQVDLWDSLYLGPPLSESFKSNFVSISNSISKNKLKITPQIAYKWQKPWRLNVPDRNYTNNKTFRRLTPSLNISFNSENLMLSIGSEYNYDILKQPSFVNPYYEEEFKNGSNYLDYHNIGNYVQLFWNTNYLNLSLGARYDYSSEFGSAFVPRIAITKAFKKYHFKLMWNKSYRTPGGILPNRNPGNSKLRPEMGIIYEIEMGYAFAKNSMFTVNVYDITFNDIITYNEPELGIGFYSNQGKIGTAGIEFGLKYNSNRFNGNITFAYYRRKNAALDSIFFVPTNEKEYLSLTPYRFNGILSYKAFKEITFSITSSYYGSSFSYDYYSNADILVKHKPLIMFGINAQINNFPLREFSTQLIMSNLLGADFKFHQPYKGNHAPLPGLDRSIGLRVSYNY